LQNSEVKTETGELHTDSGNSQFELSRRDKMPADNLQLGNGKIQLDESPVIGVNADYLFD
jgi:hypothetical protein